MYIVHQYSDKFPSDRVRSVRAEMVQGYLCPKPLDYQSDFPKPPPEVRSFAHPGPNTHEAPFLFGFVQYQMPVLIVLFVLSV